MILSIADSNATTMLDHKMPMHTFSALPRLMLMLNKQKDQSKGVLSAVLKCLILPVSYTTVYHTHICCTKIIKHAGKHGYMRNGL